MLEALVGTVVVLLVIAGVLVMIGPSYLTKRLHTLRRTRSVLTMFEPGRSRDVVPPALNPKTQRVIVAAARLAN